MFWLLCALAFSTAVLYTMHVGHRFDSQGWPERAACWSLALVLAAVCAAFFERARMDSPALWHHYFLLVAYAISTTAFAIQRHQNIINTRRSRHVLSQTHDEIVRWLAEVEHFRPCHNEDCERVRDEMRTLAIELRPHVKR